MEDLFLFLLEGGGGGSYDFSGEQRRTVTASMA